MPDLLGLCFLVALREAAFSLLRTAPSSSVTEAQSRLKSWIADFRSGTRSFLSVEPMWLRTVACEM